MSDSKGVGFIVAIFVAIAAIGALFFGLGLNVGGTANQAEIYFGIVMFCVGLFGAIIILALTGRS